MTHLVWIDLEMTGLDPDHDVIIEIATIITDSDLEVIAEGPELAIHQSDERLAGMDEWNQTHHKASGLIDRVKSSQVSMVEAEATTLEFISRYVEENQSPLCGNSVWQDRRFLTGQMPTLEQYLHYRLIDVSTVKELALRWRPEVAKGVVKKNEHLALADIRESIEELRHYRKHLF
jgi:oligoribonuclease